MTQPTAKGVGVCGVILLALMIPALARAQSTQELPPRPSVPQDQQPKPNDLVRPGRRAAAALPPAPALPSWPPPAIDASIPPVQPGVPCDTKQVVWGAGQRLKELVADLEKFTATEQVIHEEIGRDGKPRASKPLSFNYLMSIREIRPGMLSAEEVRNGSNTSESLPSEAAATGLPALVLMFHPIYAGDFLMTCEGMGEWRGMPAWQVSFVQRPDKPARIRDYRMNGRAYFERLTGRAWIDPVTYDIERLESSLALPVIPIGLTVDTVFLEYHPVDFRGRRIQLWLPEVADVYLAVHGHRYHQRHAFANYLLFSVEETQQIAAPKGADQPPDEPAAPASGAQPQPNPQPPPKPPAR